MFLFLHLFFHSKVEISPEDTRDEDIFDILLILILMAGPIVIGYQILVKNIYGGLKAIGCVTWFNRIVAKWKENCIDICKCCPCLWNRAKRFEYDDDKYSLSAPVVAKSFEVQQQQPVMKHLVPITSSNPAGGDNYGDIELAAAIPKSKPTSLKPTSDVNPLEEPSSGGTNITEEDEKAYIKKKKADSDGNLDKTASVKAGGTITTATLDMPKNKPLTPFNLCDTHIGSPI